MTQFLKSTNNIGNNFARTCWRSTTLNSKLDVGDSVTVVIISVTDNTNDSYEQLTIDGSAVTEQWIGGHPPGGGATGYDMYSYNIIKTDDATWLVFANKVNYT